MSIMDSMDFHVHTSRSICCQQSQTLSALVDAYAVKGITHIALCDHYYQGRLDQFAAAREEVDALVGSHGLDLRLSAELEIADDTGRLDCPEFEGLVGLLDHVSAAPHTKTFNRAMPQGCDPVEYIHRAHMAALDNPHIDVILHPWDGAEAVVGSLYDVPGTYFTEFAEAAKAKGKIVEISNCINHYWIRPTAFTESYDLLVREFLRAGTPMVVGSDGHNMTLVPEAWHLSVGVTTGDTSWAVAAIRRLGGSDDDIVIPSRRRG